MMRLVAILLVGLHCSSAFTLVSNNLVAQSLLLNKQIHRPISTLRMSEGPDSDQATEQRNPLSRTDSPWFERTTTLDREQRAGGDPLAPKKRPAQTGPPSPSMRRRMDIEKQGYDWYESMEGQRSMFGSTLNPMTGKLEKKDKSVPVMNPLTDPIFYILISIGAPVIIMVLAAYSCVVPTLSMVFGAQCNFY